MKNINDFLHIEKLYSFVYAYKECITIFSSKRTCDMHSTEFTPAKAPFRLDVTLFSTGDAFSITNPNMSGVQSLEF